jgi:hypothetical protein
VNLRLLDWMMFAPGAQRELGALYDNCVDCDPSTFFTAFHYDIAQHLWAARWMNGGHAAPVWSGNSAADLALTQVYAVLAEPDGHEFLASWRHFDYGKLKPIDDFVYQYDVDSMTGLDRTQLLKGKQAEAIEQRLCQSQEAVSGIGRGQNSALCQPVGKVRPERRPVTTPPANNHGQSVPPGSKHNKPSQ